MKESKLGTTKLRVLLIDYFLLQIHRPRVYPDDRTDVNMSHDIKNHISWGNKKLPKSVRHTDITVYYVLLRDSSRNGLVLDVLRMFPLFYLVLCD